MLLAAVLAFADETPPGPPPPPPPPLSSGVQLADDAPRAATLSQDQIVARLVELKATRPSLVAPIVLISVGGALLVPGIYFLYATLTVASATAMSMNSLVGIFGTVGTFIFGAFAVVFLAPAAILLTIGAIQLPLRLAAMRAQDEEEAALRRQLGGARPEAPPPAPPPPPLPPSQVFYLQPVLQPAFTF